MFDSIGYDQFQVYPYSDIDQATVRTLPRAPTLERRALAEINAKYPYIPSPSGVNQPDIYTQQGLQMQQRLHGITRNVEQHALLDPAYTGTDAGYQTVFGMMYGAPGQFTPSEPQLRPCPCSQSTQVPMRALEPAQVSGQKKEGFGNLLPSWNSPNPSDNILIFMLFIIFVIMCAQFSYNIGFAQGVLSRQEG